MTVGEMRLAQGVDQDGLCIAPVEQRQEQFPLLSRQRITGKAVFGFSLRGPLAKDRTGENQESEDDAGKASPTPIFLAGFQQHFLVDSKGGEY